MAQNDESETGHKSTLNKLAQRLFGETAKIRYTREDVQAQGNSTSTGENKPFTVIAMCCPNKKELPEGQTTSFETKILGKGVGDTTEEAEQAAAQMAYEHLMRSYPKGV